MIKELAEDGSKLLLWLPREAKTTALLERTKAATKVARSMAQVVTAVPVRFETTIGQECMQRRATATDQSALCHPVLFGFSENRRRRACGKVF